MADRYHIRPILVCTSEFTIIPLRSISRRSVVVYVLLYNHSQEGEFVLISPHEVVPVRLNLQSPAVFAGYVLVAHADSSSRTRGVLFGTSA